MTPTDLSGVIAAAAKGAGRGLGDALREESEALDRAYTDRNLLAIAYVIEIVTRETYGLGGYYYHDDEDYPVVWVCSCHDQQSWHVSPALEALLDESPLDQQAPPDGWDGHTREQKNRRLVRQIRCGGATRLA